MTETSCDKCTPNCKECRTPNECLECNTPKYKKYENNGDILCKTNCSHV